MNNAKNLKDIKVALIMDEFSYNSFKYEFNALVVEPDNWKEIFQTEKPDLFLCESAWHGTNPKTKVWDRKISTNTNSKLEKRTELLEILEYCQKHSIPTIFWNKEDPTHYRDPISSFANTAVKFDHIFTSAEECITDYKTDYGHDSVHSLMFAAQPRLFNPIEEDERTDDVIFAGSWYGRHPRRCEEMRNIFNKVLESGYKLKIYDRTYYSKLDDSYNFPSEYQEFVNPAVSHDQMANVYKESKCAININTVTDSDTMFARRAFELILCNTLVLSNHSKGLEKLFNDNIIFMDKNKINLEHNQEKRLKNLYNVLKNHTYTNRFKEILDTIHYPYLETDKTVTIYYQTETPEETVNAVEHFRTIDYQYKKCKILEKTNHKTKSVPPQPKQLGISIIQVNNFEELEGITNNSEYFIFADTSLKSDFIEKALLHYSYIKTKYGIVVGNNFKFKNTRNTMNTLFNSQCFEEILLTHWNNKEQTEIPVYTIKI
ncbi:MAG: glycosyltransferase [Methanobacterium sp. ERen5]|nr:MAG: glycosyltransferase [Methanobacterium sp. ERen5]